MAGDGPRRQAIEATAPENVRFLGRVSDARLAELYASCRALIHPQEEDFGIVAIEAMAAGRPVIALAAGGALETVVDVRTAASPTGLLFERQDPDCLVEAVLEFEAIQGGFDPAAIRRHATQFSLPRFQREFVAALERSVGPLPILHERLDVINPSDA